MLGPQLRFFLKCLVVLILAAVTTAVGIRRFQRATPSDLGSEAGAFEERRSEEKTQPEKITASLGAQTRQTKSGSLIQLTWDPVAKPIRDSSYGTLYIYDGGVPNKVILQRDALESGSTNYTPATDEVTFHLILERGRPGGESMLVVLGTEQGARIGLESKR